MLTVEALISSTLALGALLLISSSSIVQNNQFVQFSQFLEVSDIASTISDSCDFSKLNLNPNFCYSCSVSNSGQIQIPNISLVYPSIQYSSPDCVQIIPKEDTVSVSLPIFTGGKIEKISIQKYLH